MQIKVHKLSPLNSPKTDSLEIVLMEDLKCCCNRFCSFKFSGVSKLQKDLGFFFCVQTATDTGSKELLSQDHCVQHIFLSQGCCGGRQISWKLSDYCVLNTTLKD